MARRTLSNQDLKRTIVRSWHGLKRARVDGSARRIVGHERTMNRALDELGQRLLGHADHL